MKIIRTVATIIPFKVTGSYITVKSSWAHALSEDCGRYIVKRYGLANKTKTTIVIDNMVKTIIVLEKCYICWLT